MERQFDIQIVSPDLLPVLRRVLQNELKEDLGAGDPSAALLKRHVRAEGRFIAREGGVLAGVDAIGQAYEHLGGGVDVELAVLDGERVEAGTLIATATGSAGLLLNAERVILNLIQHLSGIATGTALAVEALSGSGTKVCDTRKTVPGLRALQKYAVRCGGGVNHRIGLDGGIMIKDNHIAACGGIQPAVNAARRAAGPMSRIEVECETESQISEAVAADVDLIMLDNFAPEEIQAMRRIIPESIRVEISGGITAGTAGEYRECGADFVSIGSLTHSARALDISFNLDGVEKSYDLPLRSVNQ